jgi:hypothetical protein
LGTQLYENGFFCPKFSFGETIWPTRDRNLFFFGKGYNHVFNIKATCLCGNAERFFQSLLVLCGASPDVTSQM